MSDGPDVHLVMHNYATRKTPRIKAWRAPPTLACSFHANVGILDHQVERWFAELMRKQLQRGVHRSTAELEADIDASIETHNENPTPYKWVKSADQILASVKRSCQKTMNRT